MVLKEITVSIQALLLKQGGTKRVGNHSRKRLEGIGFEVSEVTDPCQGIDADEVVELCDGHLFGRSFHKAAAAQHVVIVEPLCRIGLQIDIPCCLIYLLPSCIVLPKIIIIGRSHDVELCHGIVQAELLTLREAAFLGKDTLQTLLCTQAAVEERLPVAYALHDLHGQDIGTEQFQLVAAQAVHLPQEVERLVVTHLLIGNVGHVVECLCLCVGIS